MKSPLLGLGWGAPGAARRPARWVCSLLLLLGMAGCDSAYPEVIVINNTSEHIQLRNLSFSGCLWSTVLSYGEATAPGRCLPGADRVHFQKLDAHAYCQGQVEDGTIDGLCSCDGTVGDTAPALVSEVPTWFNYQTLSTRSVDYGDFIVIEITLDDMEQDFSVPGPYGH